MMIYMNNIGNLAYISLAFLSLFIFFIVGTTFALFLFPAFLVTTIFVVILFAMGGSALPLLPYTILFILFYSVLTSIKQRSYKILDSSLFIDGRLMELAEAGYLDGPFVIPKFVISELHRLADSEDKIRRMKGRKALENVSKLQAKHKVIIDRKNYNTRDVDTKLIKLAKYRKATLITTDFNLTKVGDIEGIKVLNLNSLSIMVRKMLMPNEELIVELVKKGDKENQAVGYLDDGTMVVVEGGKVGKKMKATVTSTYPTQAGRIIFAKLK